MARLAYQINSLSSGMQIWYWKISTIIHFYQNFINHVKSFVEKNPNVFEIVALAKKLIKVEIILEGSLNDQNKLDLKELKNFVSKSTKFNEFYDRIVENEKNTKLNIIDHEILKLEGRIETSKEYLQKIYRENMETLQEIDKDTKNTEAPP